MYLPKQERTNLNEQNNVRQQSVKNDNQFGSDDIPSGHEKKIEEQLRVIPNGEVKQYKDMDNRIQIASRNIEMDMRNRKREISMKKEEKVEMEKMRRWRVKINNIYITPLVKKMDAFLQFTIGGDFSVTVYKDKNKNSYKKSSGSRGYTDKTEVLLHLDTAQENGTGGRTPFQKIIEIEMRMSYSMINKQKIMVELWEYNSFSNNTIHGYKTWQLIDIVNGYFNVNDFITKREEGKKNPMPFAFVEFNLMFEEIWDFNLSFDNWKCSNLLNPKKKRNPNAEKPNTRVEIKLLSATSSPLNSTTVSEITKHSDTPIWTKFNNNILFRGTGTELENENVKISVYDTTGILNKTIASKVITLKGLIDFEKLKTPMLVRDKEDGENYQITVEGLVSIDNKPRYKQLGTNVLLLSKRKYLVLKIMRVENIRPAEKRGIVDSFISVEWWGMNQRTRTVKENNNPSFNELLYFQVPLQEKYLQDIDKYLLQINEELSSKNEVSFNLMIEGDDNTYDNFGIGYFYLCDLKGGTKMQEKFYAEDLKKEKKYLSEKYTGKIKLKSAFSQSNNTFLHFEAWFLENFPPQVDFGEKKKKKELADKIPQELKKRYKRGEDDPFSKEFKNTVNKIFLKYSNYPFKERMFTNLTPQDQYTNKHLLPYYLSPISVPEKRYSKKDIQTNPYFFDCNINSLHEAAHFVRCFSFPSDLKNDIWSSPDFMLKLRKGNVEEHAILMACLMLGLQPRSKEIMNMSNLITEESEEDESITGNNERSQLIKDDSTPQTKTPHEDNVTKKPLDDNNEENNENDEEDKMIDHNDINLQNKTDDINNDNNDLVNDNSISFGRNTEASAGSFPYEDRIFVCQGKLKETKEPYTWVMSFSEDYTDITFWDPKLFKQFELRARVEDPKKLENFLKGKYATYEAVNDNLTEDYQQKEDDDEEAKKLLNKQKTNQNVDINIEGDENVRYTSFDDLESQENISIHDNRNDGGIPDIHYGITTQKEMNDAIFEEVNKEQSKGNEKNFLPIESFKDSCGRKVDDSKLYLPYETIDLIFNRNNIFANCQYHSPDQIYYNLYEKEKWLPYFTLDNAIWRGKFEPFYSLCNFGPVYSQGLVKKMTDALIMEMRVGIAAARSGKNLPTRFKKKNEVINKQLGKYLDLLENRSLNRISESQFNRSKNEWKIIVKKYMPKFYRMEAQAIFFNFFETEIIRREITEDLEEFWYSKIKNVVFATSAKVYAYANQVVSVRIILAKIYKIPLEDIKDKEEEKEYQEMLKEDPNKLVEEEVDSDEEEEKRLEEEAKRKTQEQMNKKQETKDGKEEIKNEKSDVEQVKIVDEKMVIDADTNE